jgi:hypothetical protein
MALLQGTVSVVETGRKVAGLTATFLRTDDGNKSLRLGSVATDSEGRFQLEIDVTDGGWDLVLVLTVEGSKRIELYRDPEPRRDAGPVETWTIHLPAAALAAAGVLAPTRSIASELPALGSILARAGADAAYEDELRTVVRTRLDPLRDEAAAVATQYRAELLLRGRGGAPPALTGSIAAEVRQRLAAGLTSAALRRPRRGFAVVTEAERAAIAAATGPDGRVPAAVIEPLLFGSVRDGARTAIDLLATVCRTPRAFDGGCPPAPPPESAPDPEAIQRDLAAAVWTELQRQRTGGSQRPAAADVWRSIDGLNVATGPADAPALHDFAALQLPFPDVWRDQLDDEAIDAAAQLHDELERLGGRPRPAPGATKLDHLRSESTFLVRSSPRVMAGRKATAIASPLLSGVWDEPAGLPDPLDNRGQQWVQNLLAELERKLNEPYVFTVYGADDTGAAINFGVIATYRQRWRPINYQAGRLVETITLAPREERTYSRKVTTAAKRRVDTKQKWKALQRSEETVTQRAVRDIVATAEHRTGLEASGSYGALSGSISIDDARTSSDTRQNFREAVRKASSEYETDRSVDIAFEANEDVVSERTGKLTNPNDELAVTYLFYQLQRRYHVSERLHRVTPVILVAQPVPKPNQISITWILQHDWILRRVLIDDSFRSALDAVNTSLVGDEAAVAQLRLTLDQQRATVQTLRESLASSHKESALLFTALQRLTYANADLDEAGNPNPSSDLVERLIEWLRGAGLTAEQKRVRRQTAEAALERSEVRERALAEELQRELAGLGAATAQWASASRALLDKTVEVQRLRLHLKQNILYYMQAIWDHEPPDQRYFRLHQVPVPVITGQLQYTIEDDPLLPPLPPYWSRPVVVRADLEATVTAQTIPLGEVADLDQPLGYKGNYAIFPLREASLVGRFMMLPYVDRHAGAHDPDHLANLTRADLEAYVCCAREHLSPAEYEAIRPGLVEAHRRVLADPRPLEEEIAVPTDALFIEALPAERPLLEDYKLRHRAADVDKVEAEASRVRLDNLRRGSRILAGDLSDPDIDKKTLIEGASIGVVVPGDE